MNRAATSHTAGRLLLPWTLAAVAACAPGPTGPMVVGADDTEASGTTALSVDTPSSGELPPDAIIDLQPMLVHEDDPSGLIDMALLQEGGRTVVLLRDGASHVALDLTGIAGEHDAGDRWDGTRILDAMQEPGDLHVAGDQNGDGYEDYFLGSFLVHGPILGREVDVGRDAVVDFGWNAVVVGNVDADGDGTMDVLTSGGHLLFGPFGPDSLHPDEAPEVDPASYRSMGPVGVTGALLLRDHLGAGEHVVVWGTQGLGPGFDSVAYALPDGPGVHLELDDALASFDLGRHGYGPHFDDVGDVDGDGQRDFIYGDVAFPRVGAGPVSGTVELATGYDTVPQALSHTEGVHPQTGLGDLNGDGVEELVLFVEDLAPHPDAEDPTELLDWHVLMFSPHTTALDPADGLPIGAFLLGHTGDLRSAFGRYHADIDGDGLDDVVALAGGGREIRVWYGASLVEAER